MQHFSKHKKSADLRLILSFIIASKRIVGFFMLYFYFQLGDIFLEAAGWDHSWSGGKAKWTG